MIKKGIRVVDHRVPKEVAHITEKEMKEKLKKYVKRLSAEKLLESYRFATIVECFGQISEVLLDMGKEEEGYELMDTASKITDTQIKGALKEKK